MTDKTKNDVRNAQMDLLIEADRICEKCRINYTLVFGTLIGAIRHNGFIPWDDDIDIGMLREDYDKFIEACKTELDPDYELFDWWKDVNSPISFLKLRIKGTRYEEEVSKDVDVHREIFIDIFPIDNAPDLLLFRRIHALHLRFLKRMLGLKSGYLVNRKGGLKTIKYMVAQRLADLHSMTEWKKRYEKTIKRYDSVRTKNVVIACGAYPYERKVQNRETIAVTMPHAFEDIVVSVPREYDKCLTKLYGNYMQLPPEEARIGRHEVSSVDFGQYKIRHGSDKEVI